MSPSTNTPNATRTLEQALTELPAKLRVHELAKRAGLTSREVLAALSAAGVKAASAASSVSADDATTALTTLLGADDSPPDPVDDQQTDGNQVETDGVPDAGSAAAAAPAGPDLGFTAPLFLPPAETKPARRRRGAKAPAPSTADDQPALPAPHADDDAALGLDSTLEPDSSSDVGAGESSAQTPEQSEAGEPTTRSGRRRRGRSGGRGRGQSLDPAAEQTDEPAAAPTDEPIAAVEADIEAPSVDEADADVDDDEDGDQARRRRRRGRRGRGRAGDERAEDAAEEADVPTEAVDESNGDEVGTEAVAAVEEESEDESGEESGDDESNEDGGTRRRRRRRRRSGSAEPVAQDGKTEDDPDNTVVHVREPRPPRESQSSSSSSEVQGIRGSTRLEAKRQRRRDSRGDRKRPQILTEAEFLARREAVDRVMAVRQRGDLAQVALLEDGILVEHFVSRAGSESLMGNIYLGKVQNVLPSMEAAFVDIGKGRNAVLYAGEVNWEAAGLGGKARRIETALSGGDTILVQVSKDPVGQKGARLTTQISLPGRFLVYVPGGGATGISRKLPDTERKRLKSILDRIVPEDAGVIIRTAAEGVAEEELARDVDRLKTQWEQISRQAEKKSNAPLLLSAEPDTLIKVVRDLFNSDISRLVLDGDQAYEPVAAYIDRVAPELSPRVSKYDGPLDVFSAYRIDEQIAKALERKVYLPSGGSLVIDRTEAMTVVDVNTGKYTGSGGNLEETVTKNNLEAAEEVVRQLRLRDIGGIIVVDFIDMVLESNRELVMRRLTECLGRDRTRHQVAEVTSLGLIQMTRKKMGTGLVEAFSEPCPHCQGRGILLHDVPMEDRSAAHDEDAGKSRRRGKGRQDSAPEPEPIVKLVPATVRPPDPRGPRPPSRANGEPAPDTGSTVHDHGAPPAEPATPSAPNRTAGGDGGSNASFNAPRSRDASDAVSAVLAALDAQATRQAGDGAVPAAASAEVGLAGGRRRGRRAAGRPAGAPNALVAPLPDAGDGAAAGGTSAAGAVPGVEVPGVEMPDVGVPDVGVPDAEVPDLAVPDAEVPDTQMEQGDAVGSAVKSEVLEQAAFAFVPTDRGLVADVDAQTSVTVEPDPDEPVGVEPAVEPEPAAVEPESTGRPRRRRAGRPAGAAVAATGNAATAPDADHGSADIDSAGNGGADIDSAVNGSAVNGGAVDGSAVDGSADIDSAVNGSAGVDTVVDATALGVGAVDGGSARAKAAPRRRRAASRPAGPAGGSLPDVPVLQ